MVNHLEKKLQVVDEQMYKVKGGSISEMPKSGQPFGIDAVIAEKDELERRINKFLEQARQQRKEVQNLIDTVISPKHNDFLTMYFIRLMSVEEISNKLKYNNRHAWRVFRESITMVSENCNEKEFE